MKEHSSRLSIPRTYKLVRSLLKSLQKEKHHLLPSFFLLLIFSSFRSTYTFSASKLLVGHQEEHLACKNWVMIICLEWGANDLHMVQLMPLSPIISFFNKIQNGFTFLVPAYPGCPKKRLLNGCCCCFSVWGLSREKFCQKNFLQAWLTSWYLKDSVNVLKEIKQ